MLNWRYVINLKYVNMNELEGMKRWFLSYFFNNYKLKLFNFLFLINIGNEFVYLWKYESFIEILRVNFLWIMIIIVFLVVE